MIRSRDERVKQVVIGVGILIALTVMVPLTLISWRLLPGLFGEWIGTMIGIMTTPFFMEASFSLLGLLIVITLNHWRQHKDGDELVYLDQVTGSQLSKDLPENSRWAIYHEKPLIGEAPSLLTQAEGAFTIGDYLSTANLIGAMSQNELDHLDTLRLRLELARATDHHDLADRLEEEFRLAKAATDNHLNTT